MIHIRKKNNPTPFDLAPDAEITLTYVNPALDKNGIERVFTLPFTLPFTPRNLALRAHSNRIDTPPAEQVPVTIHIGSHLRATGQIRQIGSNTEAEEIQIVNEIIDIWKKLGEFKISEVLPTITTPDLPANRAYWVFDLDPANNQLYSIQLQTGTAQVTAGGNAPGDRDAAALALVPLLNAIAPGIAEYAAAGKVYINAAVANTNIPLAWVNIDLESVTTTGESAMKNMAAHVATANGTGVDTHSFPLVRWFGLYGNTFVKNFEEWCNGFANTTMFNNIPYEWTEENPYQWENTLVPMVKVYHLLQLCSERIGINTWTGDVYESEDFQNLVIANNKTLDQIYEDIYTTQPPKRLNGFVRSFNLNEHVPELTAAEFLERLCTTLNLELRYQDNALQFIPNVRQLRVTPNDWRNRTSLLLSKKTTYDKGWSMVYAENNDTYPVPSPQLTTLTSGDGKNVRTVVPTLPFFTGMQLRTHGNVKAAVAKQAGISAPLNNGTRSTMPLVFLFDRGMRATSNGQQYRMSTHDNLLLTGATAGLWSLDIATPNGLYAIHHKGHIELSDSDELKFEILLTIGELNILTKWNNTRARIYHSLGECTVVIKSLEERYTAKGMSAVQVTALKA